VLPRPRTQRSEPNGKAAPSGPKRRHAQQAAPRPRTGTALSSIRLTTPDLKPIYRICRLLSRVKRLPLGRPKAPSERSDAACVISTRTSGRGILGRRRHRTGCPLVPRRFALGTRCVARPGRARGGRRDRAVLTARRPAAKARRRRRRGRQRTGPSGASVRARRRRRGPPRPNGHALPGSARSTAGPEEEYAARKSGTVLATSSLTFASNSRDLLTVVKEVYDRVQEGGVRVRYADTARVRVAVRGCFRGAGPAVLTEPDECDHRHIEIEDATPGQEGSSGCPCFGWERS